MDYKYNKCPICGSPYIEVTSIRTCDRDTIYDYKCLSCDQKFSSLHLKENEAARALRNEAKTYEFKIARNNIENGELTAKDIFKKNERSVLEIICAFSDGEYSYGTGVVFEDGLILTNAHVMHPKNEKVEMALSYRAHFNKSKVEYDLHLIHCDDSKDLAAFKCASLRAKPVSISKEFLETGEKCFALGNSKAQGISIVDGIVSDNRRYVNGEPFIMFSALVTTGNSGGPLFNSKGEFIGLVTMGRSDALAMNYAIPNDVVNDFVDALNEHFGG